MVTSKPGRQSEQSSAAWTDQSEPARGWRVARFLPIFKCLPRYGRAANQELIALGIANVGASFTAGYPVTGGFGHSAVNFEAGASTPLASVVTATLVDLAVTFLMPMFYYIPHTVLTAVIVVTVISLVDWRMPFCLWRSSKADAFAVVITFVAVFALGIEIGVLVGMGTLRQRVAKNHSSYAYISDPVDPAELRWLASTLLWESAWPYMYLRSTGDGRLLVGGEDDDRDIPARQDRLFDRKAATLQRKVSRLFPHLHARPAFAWANTFAETNEALPPFGRHPQYGVRVLLALAYGGNGISYSMIGAELLRAQIERRPHPLTALFSFARLGSTVHL